MLLQRLRQSTARTTTTKRRRAPPLPLTTSCALSSSAALDDFLQSVAATSPPSSSPSSSASSSSPWRPPEEIREAMLPQPQYEGDWEIQAEEEEQQQRRLGGRRGERGLVVGEEGEEEGEEEDEEEDAWEAEGHLRRLRPHLSPSSSSSSSSSRRTHHPHAGHNLEEDTVRRRLGQPSLRCPALVLNQDLTPLTLFPLTIAPWWSAVRSTLRGRVSVLQSYDRRVRSTHALHQLPSVVALTRQQTPSYKHLGVSSSSSSSSSSSTCSVEGGREGEVEGEGLMPPAASRIPRPFRRNVALRDGYVCCFCGRRLSYRTLTLDHVVPKCLGGEDSWENLASACQQCNSRKGSLRVSELGQINMRLLRAPYAPTALQLAYAYVDLLPATILQQWGRYLEGPLAREAAKLRAFHAAFSLPSSFPSSLSSSSSTATAAAATVGGTLAPFQRLEEEEAMPRVLVSTRAGAAAAAAVEEERIAPVSVPFVLSTS